MIRKDATAQDLLAHYESVINEHDFDLLVPLFSSACRFWFSSGTFEGHQQVRAAFEKTWSMIADEVYTLSEKIWIAESDSVATCLYTFHWKGIIDGQVCEGKGRGTTCLRKEDNGWKIVHEHLSKFP
jgi:ketosteroid isomerase-like protein